MSKKEKSAKSEKSSEKLNEIIVLGEMTICEVRAATTCPHCDSPHGIALGINSKKTLGRFELRVPYPLDGSPTAIDCPEGITLKEQEEKNDNG